METDPDEQAQIQGDEEFAKELEEKEREEKEEGRVRDGSAF